MTSQRNNASQFAQVSTTVPEKAPSKNLTLVQTLIGECLCAPLSTGDAKITSPTTQFLELNGIQYISLGAVMDELSPKERVHFTLEQLSTKAELLVSIGYLKDGNDDPTSQLIESIPLDIWEQNYPSDRNMTRALKRSIATIKEGNFSAALKIFEKDYETQNRNIQKSANKFVIGITTHNMGVASILTGSKYTLSLFEDAVQLKKESFGPENPEVAKSLNELGIQLFAAGKFQEALSVFNECKKILTSSFGSTDPRLSMTLNNIACCHSQMGNTIAASLIIHEARALIRENKGTNTAARDDLDLVHLGILLNNCGYLKAQVKQYEEATSYFEEALLIQQSVLGDAYSHRAIQDSRNNLDFVNAFHS
eukprot:Nitzschia sp. Nitz4//scaffold286_size23798//17959//19219//NITZ4_008454-RA/size23798-augustus-gene-0.14-mRNA-1//1//CDS//3329545750//4833//frame0